MPRRRERPRLRLAIPDDTGRHQTRIVEDRAKSMAQRISQLPALMDRPGTFGRYMTRNAAGKRELFEQSLQTRRIPRDVRIHLAISPFQIGIGNKRRPTVTGARDIDHVEIML